MALVPYPDIPQCEGSTRNEVTNVLTDVSDNGVIRGRTMDDTSTYELSLVHIGLTHDTFAMLDAWWQTNKRNRISVTWVPDGVGYDGVPKKSPAVRYVNGGFDVTMILLVKQSV